MPLRRSVGNSREHPVSYHKSKRANEGGIPVKGQTLTRSILGVVAMVLLGGCAKPEETVDYARPLPPGVHALRKLTDPEMLPDLAAAFAGDRQGLVAAIGSSLKYLAHPSSHDYYPVQDITHERVVASLQQFRRLLASPMTAQQLQTEVIRTFDIYQSVGCDDRGTVLFTGYYQPIFDGSREKTDRFKYPLYKLPPDLVKDAEGLCVGRLLPDGRTVPYPTRRELETRGQLDGLELVYLADKFDAYICHVQGSGLIRLPDGQWLEVGYAGKNAGQYRSVGRMLLDEGKISPEKYSLGAIRSYFREHPEEVDRYCRQNDAFVFFQATRGGPYGSLGVPVTPYRSLATDKQRDPSTGDRFFPRASLALVQTTLPVREGDRLVGRPFNQFVLDQDTGGAIRAAGRADIFLGTGHEAGQIAGWTANTGKLYYLVLKTEVLPGAPTAAH